MGNPQNADGKPHLAYFDKRDPGISIVWDGKSKLMEVSLNGYGEPVHHRTTAPSPDMPADGWESEFHVSFKDILEEFHTLAQVHCNRMTKKVDGEIISEIIAWDYYKKPGWKVVQWNGDKKIPEFWK